VRLISGEHINNNHDKCSSTSSLSLYNHVFKLPMFNGLMEQSHLPCPTDNATVSCRIGFMRRYLPDPTWYQNIITYQKKSRCDMLLSKEIENHLIHYNNKFMPRCGFMDRVTIGKHTRFYTLSVYHFLTGDSFHDHLPLNILPNWYLTRDFPECNQTNTLNWNCAFVNLNESSNTHHHHDASTMAHSELATKLNRFPEPMSDLLRNLTSASMQDHVAQMILFGKLSAMVVRPSKSAENYFLQNVVSINPEQYSGCSGATCRYSFSSMAEFMDDIATLHYLKPDGSFSQDEDQHVALPAPLSLSLHVRGGDACDVILDKEQLHRVGSNWERVIENGVEKGIGRACWSPNVYMSVLHRLRQQYNVRRVYVSTDSQDMIDRMYQEPLFNWVFSNVSRRLYDHGNGWIERKQLNVDERRHVVFGAVTDFNLMKYGEFFVGAFSSHYSKISYYINLGHQMRLTPFISLDFPLSCDTAECGEGNGMSVRSIIMNAPECGGEGYDNHPGDRCGIQVNLTNPEPSYKC